MNRDVKAVLLAFLYLAALALILTLVRRYLIGWLLEAPYTWAVPVAFVVGAVALAACAILVFFGGSHVLRTFRGETRS